MRLRDMKTRVALLPAVAMWLLAGCAIPGADRHSWNTQDGYGTPGAVVSAISGVEFYPACGNEILRWQGKTWYPFTPENATDFPADPLAGAPSPSPVASALGVGGGAGGPGSPAASPVGAVAAPGPGDNVGTLVIYENDLAYWQSDTGTLKQWLTSHGVEHNWIC